MKTKSIVLMSALLAGFSIPMVSCGKKEKKVYVKEEPKNLVPNPSVAKPEIVIHNSGRLAEQVKDGKITVTFEVKGLAAQAQTYCKLALAAEVQAKAGTLGQACQGSVSAENLKNGDTYAVEVIAKDAATGQELAAGRDQFQVSGYQILADKEQDLQTTFQGNITLKLALNPARPETAWECYTKKAEANAQPKQLNCLGGVATLNNIQAQYPGKHTLYVSAVDANDKSVVVANKTINFCGGASCQTSAGNGGGTNNGYPDIGTWPYQVAGGGFGGVPAINGPLGAVSGGATTHMIGTDWTATIPPGFHILSYSTNHGIGGGMMQRSAELVEIMNDPLVIPPNCSPFNGGLQFGRIITIEDGDGIPYDYCQRLFPLGGDYKAETDRRPFNSVEFSTPAVGSPIIYERFAFAAFNTANENARPLSATFNQLCSRNYADGSAFLNAIPTFWNDPTFFRPVLITYCQTTVPGILGTPMDVWVAGFTFVDTAADFPSSLEMVYIGTPTAVGVAFNPAAFLGTAALKIRWVIHQTGLSMAF